MSRSQFLKMSAITLTVVVLLFASLMASSLIVRTIAAPQAVIVQLKSEPVVVAKAAAEARGQNFDAAAYKQKLIAEQESFLSQLRAAGVDFTVVSVDAPNGPNNEVTNIQFRFNYVFNGVTLAVPVEAIKTIEGMSQVKSVHRDEPITMHLDKAVDYVRAPSLYGTPPQIKMGDNLATAGGVHGEGIYIAVIDTGVDWSHPMFGGDPTPPRFGVGPAVAALNANPKVPYYLNLTAGAVQDDFGHGSHVSGITAGYLANAPGPDGLPLTADDVPIHGVAPQAKIMGYKVLSTVGSGVSSSIVMAIEDAVQPFTITGYPKPVAQVINMSLGNTLNDPDYPTSVASDNATLAGTTVVAAAGNSGAPTPTNPTGEATIGSPGSGRRVLTVGAALDPGAAPNKILELGGDSLVTKGFPLDGSAPVSSDLTANYVFCSWAETPDQVPDTVAGKIALIERGGSVNTPAASPVAAGTGLFSNKAAFAFAKGAIAVVIYNNVPGELTSSTVRKSAIPVLGMSQASGQHLKDAIGSTAFGAVSVNQIRISRELLFEPQMADFSSKGPVGGFGMVKPDVVAPGVSILSATVRVGGAGTNTATMFDPTGYISASGTSMATPMTAGVVALVQQKNPAWTPSMLRAALMNHATNLRQSDGTPVADGAQTLNQQGAGLVDALAAANAKAMMGVGVINPTNSGAGARPNALCPNYGGSPSPLCSNTPGNPDFLGSHSFGTAAIAGVVGTVTRSQTVTITDVTNGQGGGTYTLSASTVRNMPEGVSVTFTGAGGSPISEVTVPNGGTASYTVNITVNGEAVPTNPTQIESYITATRTDGGETLRMPLQLRAIAPLVATFAPNLNNPGGTEFQGNPATDINGNYQLSFAATGTNAPAKFRIEESRNNGGSWTVLSDVPSSQTSYAINGRSNGTFQYRVRGLFTVENGLMPGPSSAVMTVIVDRRLEADVTSLIEARMVDGSVALGGGVFQFDYNIRNTSGSTSIYSPMSLSITSVTSSSGRVNVKNADNGGNGVSSPATFDYTSQVGADQTLSPGETTAARRLQFNNPASEMFQISVVVRGHLPDPSGASGGDSGGAGTSAGTSSTSGGSSTGGTSSGSALPGGVTLRFLINPLTKSVSLVK